jgi:hypothetical protein
MDIGVVSRENVVIVLWDELALEHAEIRTRAYQELLLTAPVCDEEASSGCSVR